jgi:hypothetical protein
LPLFSQEKSHEAHLVFRENVIFSLIFTFFVYFVLVTPYWENSVVLRPSPFILNPVELPRALPQRIKPSTYLPAGSSATTNNTIVDLNT